MGADFVSILPSSDAHVSYSHEYDIKVRLLGLIDNNLAQTWEAISYTSNFKIEEANNKIDFVIDSLEKMLKDAGADESEKTQILRGVYYFVDHSDCDGTFDTYECKYISIALKALNAHEEGEDGAIENLIKVFDDAFNGEGEVLIC